MKFKTYLLCHYTPKKRAKPITRLSLGLTHLRDHIFKYVFLNSLNPICS